MLDFDFTGLLVTAMAWAGATFTAGALAGDWKRYMWWVMSGAAGIFFSAWAVMENVMWLTMANTLTTIFGGPEIPNAVLSFLHLVALANEVLPIVELSLLLGAILSFECIVAGISVYIFVCKIVGLFAPTGG